MSRIIRCSGFLLGIYLLLRRGREGLGLIASFLAGGNNKWKGLSSTPISFGRENDRLQVGKYHTLPRLFGEYI